MILITDKIGDGSVDNEIRPDIEVSGWSLISETETTMTINIKE